MSNTKKVLVVSNNSSINDALDCLLQMDGFTVTICGDAGCALAAVSEKTFNFLVIDYALSDMNGADLTKELRKRVPESIIIGQGAGQKKEEFLQAGATAFMLKPYGYENLKELMESLSLSALG
jgi:DNA-binding NtrC family response regulator